MPLSFTVSSLVSAGRLGVVTLGAPDGGVLLWATDAAANTPAAGAMATLYEYPEGCRPWGSKPGCDVAEVVQLHRARVDADGLLSLPAIGSVGMQRAVAVEGKTPSSGEAAEVICPHGITSSDIICDHILMTRVIFSWHGYHILA